MAKHSGTNGSGRVVNIGFCATPSRHGKLIKQELLDTRLESAFYVNWRWRR